VKSDSQVSLLCRFKAGDVCLRAFGRGGGHQTCSAKDDDLRKGI